MDIASVCANSAVHDPARLNALYATGLLDSDAEDSFDRLTRLASKILHAPVALVSLVDRDRQFFKSCYGLPEPVASTRQTPLSYSFCQHIVESGQPLVIGDARQDPLVADNRSVTQFNIAAYAGIPLITPEGHVLGSFCVLDRQTREWTSAEIENLTDLAAAVMTEINLRRARDAAESASRAKDRFLALLSHELRTPLSPALIIASSMVGEPSLPEHVREDARTIQRNIQLQTRLIDDLLDVTRIENGKLVVLRGPVDVHRVAQAAFDACHPQAQQKGIRLTLELTARRHWINGDPGRLHQVFNNLLNNAIKFTPQSGIVTMRTTDTEDAGIRIAVDDSGIGIAPELVGKIFDPFEQAGRAKTCEFTGLGLGLAISRGLVEVQGGTITAESPGHGQGTTLTVAFPTIAPPHAVEASHKPAEAVESRSSLNILLVDDHHDTLRAMSRLLRKMEHKVTTADSVATALAAATSEPFDLLISDIGLPDGTGLELMRELLKVRPIKGVALTGYGTDHDVRLSREAGYTAHLTKPIDFKMLEVILNQQIGA